MLGDSERPGLFPKEWEINSDIVSPRQSKFSSRQDRQCAALSRQSVTMCPAAAGRAVPSDGILILCFCKCFADVGG